MAWWGVVDIIGRIVAIIRVKFAGGGGRSHIIGIGAHGGHGAGGTRPEAEGRIILCRPTMLPPIVFDLVASGLCNGSELRHDMLVWMMSTSLPCVWQ
jgi:hypothetical protein